MRLLWAGTLLAFAGCGLYTAKVERRTWIDPFGDIGPGPGDAGGGDTVPPPGDDAPPPWWDAGYGYRKPILITAVDPVAADYTSSLTVDHAGLVANGRARPDGADVRLVWWNGGSWSQRDRICDTTGWGLMNTKLGFALPESLGAGQAQADLWLYYGAPAATGAPSSYAQVFHYYDDFSDAGEFATAWHDIRPGSTTPTFTVTGGQLVKSATSQSGGAPYVGEKVVLVGAEPLLGAKVIFNVAAGGDTQGVLGVGLCSDTASVSDGYYVAFTRGTTWVSGTVLGPTIGAWSAQDSQTAAWTPPSGTNFRVVVTWTSAAASVEIDGVARGTFAVGPTAAGSFCIISDGVAAVTIDNLVLRHLVPGEPVVALGAEETP